MRHNLLSVVLFFFCSITYGQCPTTSVILTTQAEVDAFIIDYPSCTQLDEILQITNGTDIVNLNGLSNLISISGYLEISNNPLLDDLTGLNGLESVYWFWILGNDSLTSLQGLNGLTNATDLFPGQYSIISSNPLLSNLDALSSLVDIDGLVVDDNDSLVTLSGLESLSDLSFYFDIINNDVLADISAIENVSLFAVFTLNIHDNPQLAMCSVSSICTYINDAGSSLIFNNAPGCNTEMEILDGCADTVFSEIKGQVLYDFNANGCDIGDYPADGVLVEIENATFTRRVPVDDLGNYSTLVDPDTYTVSIVPGSLPAYFLVTPASVGVSFTGAGEEAIADFCLKETQSVTDVSVSIIPTLPPRPGFQSRYILHYENVGTTIQSGEILLNFDDALIEYVSSSQTPLATTINSITWGYVDLLPFESRSFEVRFNVFPPPTVQGGENLISNVAITPVSTDDVPGDNFFELSEIVVNSYDPNDKQVLQGDEVTPEETGEYLDYIVRFQNTGTASAITVRIDDILSNNLDWNSFKPLTASHDYNVEITDENEVSFHFEDINLPAESQDEAGSNGYVAFKVRSDAGLPLGSTIENTASIFFDFNPAIITNTVVTTVAESLSVADFMLNGISVFPNPTSADVEVTVKDGTLEVNGLSLYSITGQQLKSSNESVMNLEDLQNGIYFLVIITPNGNMTRKIVKKS